MAWNEPGGNQKDPWGGGNRGNNDGPPDLDEALKNFQKKLSGIFGGKKSGFGGGNSAGSGFNGVLIGIIAVVLAVGYIFAGVGIVNEQERAVVLRLGVFHETKGPGLRWNPPLIDQVETVNVTRVDSEQFSEQMLTKDLNIVDINLSVQFVIADARDFVLNVRSPRESLRQASNSALRHVAGSTPMHDVLTQGREQMAIEIKGRIQAYLDTYGTGISIETVNVEESKPPREVQAAFDDVIKAREDEERYKNEAQTYANEIIPKARGAAQRVLEEAAAYKERVIARADGEAQRFEYLLTEYKKSPEVTRNRLYLDAVQDVMANSSKVLIDVEGGNNMLYLPLDKITNSAGRSSSPSFSSGGVSASDVDVIANKVIERLNRAASNSRNSRREVR